MDEFHLDALGTSWTILVDGSVLSPTLRQTVSSKIQDFEDTYSRFKTTSLLTKLNADISGEALDIPDELLQMLEFSLKLSAQTDGLFDANIAAWESAYGYNAELDFKKVDQVQLPARGRFEIVAKKLVKYGLVELDLGAFGKGFLIDKVAEILKENQITHFLIDGGRDFYGTSKLDSSAWEIALEHPSDKSLAIGIAYIKNQALAASNSYHRRVGAFHHLLNGKTGLPSQEIASVFVTATTAMQADGLSTALFVSTPEVWKKLLTYFKFEYLAITANLKAASSANFPGDIFLN